MNTNTQSPRLERGPIRYRNPFRWRVMPPEQAAMEGFFDRSFGNKKRAVAYQRRVKERFPNEACCLVDTGRWYDSLGNTIR